MAHLLVQFADQRKKLALDKLPLVVGRVEGNGFVVNHTFVSRKHCQVEKAGDGYVLRDLGSSNGTFVNGQRVTDAVPLKHGLEFVVGPAKFVFQTSERVAAASGAVAASGVGDDNTALMQFAALAAPRSGSKTATRNKPAPAATSTGDAGGDQYTAEESFASVLAAPDWVVSSIESLKSFGKDVGFKVDQINVVNSRGNVVHVAQGSGGDDDRAAATNESITLLRTLLFGCCRAGASDLHLEPKRDVGQLRCRIDGVMVQLVQITPDQTKRLVSVIKVLCDIDITKKAIVQEGHFSILAPGRRVDYRVSLTPSIHGQKLVIRVLDPANAPQRLADLGLTDYMYQQIRQLTRQDAGMLLTTGPTGSGKTTTLYAALREIDTSMRNIVTIEDPVEYEVEGVTQIPVAEAQGQDFNTLLRSVLRQDPDVIVVGEIRDSETATTAMRAATTGHCVMSTLHTKDTIGAIFRLLDLGVEPYLVASSLNLVLAQRLVRRLCPECKELRRPTTNQVMRLGRAVQGVSALYAPVGCKTCFSTGYSGRVGLWEMLHVTDDLRDVILKNPTIGEIRKSVESTVFTTLRDYGNSMILKGLTSFDEIDRVIGADTQ